jgi:hypothetical protein
MTLPATMMEISLQGLAAQRVLFLSLLTRYILLMLVILELYFVERDMRYLFLVITNHRIRFREKEYRLRAVIS